MNNEKHLSNKGEANMKIKALIIIILSAFLTACESEQDVDKIVFKYIKKNYDFEVKILERESVNEANMGDRTFKVESQGKPKIKFYIYLEGIFNSKVIKDDYDKQKSTYLLGEKFSQTYRAQLTKLKYSNVEFYHKDLWSGAITVNVSYNNSISIFNDKSIEPLLQLIDLLNSFNNKEIFIYSELDIDFNGQQESIYLGDIEKIHTLDELKTRLFEQVLLVNDSLLMRDEALFTDLQKRLNKLGYKFVNDLVTPPLFCYESNLENGECTGGYTLFLRGKSINIEEIYELVKTLNSYPTLSFDRVIVISNNGDVKLEGIRDIRNMKQIEEFLKNRNN